ncbi:SCO family protein [Nocardioides mangrovi]|uniref:SCO family protein n=1 Tax=Nocardioides mangrovi TaxID=2874580 RepID=A0ABS7U7A6_9ACTN|nr:SCO family protein [Nocardioides mangrovi]MBZ5736855.1 SCO family protein [Nocardioides mangrovi]
MRRTVLTLLAGLLVTLTACGGSADGGALHATELDPPFQASSIALTDTSGAPYSLTKDADADLTLVFFGYTHCPDICQIVMGNLSSAMTRLDEADRKRTTVVFITTDPARDTSSVLKTYLSHFDPSFTGLTGDLDDIVAVGKPFAVGVSQGDKLPSGGYDVTHGTTITGMEPGGKAPEFWDQDTSSAQFASDIHELLNP